MSTYRLEHLFAPKSVALVGASPRERSVGRMILRNLREAGFAGSIGLVNPKYPEIEGIRAVKTIDELPAVPDLIIVAAPPPTVPEVVATAAAKGASTAIIITAGLGHGTGSLAEAARGLRDTAARGRERRDHAVEQRQGNGSSQSSQHRAA